MSEKGDQLVERPGKPERKAAVCDHTSPRTRKRTQKWMLEELQEKKFKSINQRFQLTLYGKPGFDKFFAHEANRIYFTTYNSDTEVPGFN